MIDRIGRESSLDCLPIDGATLTKMQRLDYFYIWRAEKRVVLAFDHLRKMPKYGVYGKLVWGEESIYMYVVCMRVEAEKETEKEIIGQFCYFVTNGLWHLLHLLHVG